MATITRTPATDEAETAETPDQAETVRSPRSQLRRTTVAVAAVAAVAAAATAAVLHAAGVPFTIDGEMIPLLGFAQMAFLWSLVGGLIAGSLRKRSARPGLRFVQTTVALTALSCVPSVTAPASNGTRAALVVTHLVAAAIVIPVLARRLDA